MSVGYEGLYCKTTALNVYNRQAPESSPLLWLVGTSTHVSESTKLLGDLGLLKGEKNADRCTDEFTLDASTVSRAKELCLGHSWQNPYFYSRSESYKLFLDRPFWGTIDLSL